MASRCATNCATITKYKPHKSQTHPLDGTRTCTYTRSQRAPSTKLGYKRPNYQFQNLKRQEGIEPSPSAWKAETLPLHHCRENTKYKDRADRTRTCKDIKSLVLETNSVTIWIPPYIIFNSLSRFLFTPRLR
jgi:hypothetical protein